MREIELNEGVWTEDGEELLFYVSETEGVKWPKAKAEYADWKDDQAKFDAIAGLAQSGEEVVILNDGSDTYVLTYVFVSMADAVPLK